MAKFSISTSLLIRSALEKGFICTYLPEKVVHISNGKTSHYFKGTSLPCNDMVSSNLACNKYFTRRILNDNNLPTPRTLTLRTRANWKSVLKSSLNFPLVVKPVNASHANGASLNIKTTLELEIAIKKAFNYMKDHKQGNRVLVEEHIEGKDLRLLVVDDEVVSVVEREPAYVIGDGKRTIRQLIHIFNKQWRSSLKYDFPLCPIPMDSEVTRYLKRNKLTLNSILQNKQKTYLRWNANVSTGGRPIDITNRVHLNIKNLAIQVTQISHLKVAGIDILCKDPLSPDITSNNLSILEVNDSPGFDIHHFPFEGVGRNVTSDILDYIFKTEEPALPAPIHLFKSSLNVLQPFPPPVSSKVENPVTQY